MSGNNWERMETANGSASGPRFEACDPSIVGLVKAYIRRLALPSDRLWVTTDRNVYSEWLHRRIPSSYGGAYCYLNDRGLHAVLINLERIDTARPRAVEVVVAEELIHMRDYLDGDHRRHARHGYDRVAYRVSELTGASLEEIRQALIPVKRRPYRYVYACPRCGIRLPRKKMGRWSCSRCSPHFDVRFILQVVEHLELNLETKAGLP